MGVMFTLGLPPCLEFLTLIWMHYILCNFRAKVLKILEVSRGVEPLGEHSLQKVLASAIFTIPCHYNCSYNHK